MLQILYFIFFSHPHLELFFTTQVWLSFVKVCFISAITMNLGVWAIILLVAKLSKWIYSDFFPIKGWEILLHFAESSGSCVWH